jgi:hypothetical protein
MLKFAVKDVSTKNSEPTNWTILSLNTANDYYDQNQIKDIAKGG